MWSPDVSEPTTDGPGWPLSWSWLWVFSPAQSVDVNEADLCWRGQVSLSSPQLSVKHLDVPAALMMCRLRERDRRVIIMWFTDFSLELNNRTWILKQSWERMNFLFHIISVSLTDPSTVLRKASTLLGILSGPKQLNVINMQGRSVGVALCTTHLFLWGPALNPQYKLWLYLWWSLMILLLIPLMLFSTRHFAVNSSRN